MQSPGWQPTLCVALCLIWWFAISVKYCHTWHRMSLLRPGVIKQHKSNQTIYVHSSSCYSWHLLCVVCYRDLVHRQTAMAAIQHLALGVYGFGCEDALTHLLNYVWPNVFETSPHVVQAFMGAVEGIRVGTGAANILHYTLQVTITCSKSLLK